MYGQSYRHDLKLALDQTRGYSLHAPYRNQATACFLHTLLKLKPAFPRKNKKRANIQPASNRREPRYSLHPPDESQLTACIVQRVNIYSLHPPHESQLTACIVQTRANLQPALSRRDPTYRQHPPDETQLVGSVLQTRLNL